MAEITRGELIGIPIVSFIESPRGGGRVTFRTAESESREELDRVFAAREPIPDTVSDRPRMLLLTHRILPQGGDSQFQWSPAEAPQSS
jgi:hypothetical protein